MTWKYSKWLLFQKRIKIDNKQARMLKPITGYVYQCTSICMSNNKRVSENVCAILTKINHLAETKIGLCKKNLCFKSNTHVPYTFLIQKFTLSSASICWLLKWMYKCEETFYKTNSAHWSNHYANLKLLIFLETLLK